MKQTINLHDFRRSFELIRPDNFSYEGLEVLFDYLDEWESSSGEELELDVIGFCVDFTEDTFQSIAANYSIEIDENENEEEQEEQVRQYLEDQGVLIGETSIGFVYRNF